MNTAEDELKRLEKEVEDYMEHNPVKSFSFSCGCKILGQPPIVDRIILCHNHTMLAEQMRNYAPHSALKVLKWWDKK